MGYVSLPEGISCVDFVKPFEFGDFLELGHLQVWGIHYITQQYMFYNHLHNIMIYRAMIDYTVYHLHQNQHCCTRFSQRDA